MTKPAGWGVAGDGRGTRHHACRYERFTGDGKKGRKGKSRLVLQMNFGIARITDDSRGRARAGFL